MIVELKYFNVMGEENLVPIFLLNILQHISCPGTPEQNGVAERKHRHIVETGLTMLFHAHMPLSFWVESFLTAVYLMNRLPSSVLKNESPYYKLYNRHPDYSGLRVLGCQCFPSLRYQSQLNFFKGLC